MNRQRREEKRRADEAKATVAKTADKTPVPKTTPHTVVGVTIPMLPLYPIF